MEYAKPVSSAKFYTVLYGGTSFIVLWCKYFKNKITLEQTTTIITLALSVILQAMPFILIGALASSLLRALVREEWIAKFAPTKGIAGAISGALLGLFFPVCDCGVMPIARSLLDKGVPTTTAFAYLLTAPVINPIVILATALAFQWNWHLVVLRVLGTFFVGTTTALLVGKFFNSKESLLKMQHSMQHPKMKSHSEKQTFHELLLHAADEFFDIGTYLILSAFLAAAIQVWLPKGLLFQFASNPYLSITAMMILAALMSLCSEADAFVARILANQFTFGSVLAFLVLGQILDLRNIILFSKNFRPALVIFIAIMSISLTFLGGLGINLLFKAPNF